MKKRTKIVAAIVFCALLASGVWHLAKNVSRPTPRLEAPRAQAQISDLRATQTHPETGEIEYTLSALSLVQSLDGVDELADVTLDWTPTKTQRYRATAGRATLDETSGDFVLKDGFVFVRFADSGQIDLQLEGSVLEGNTKDKRIQSQNALTVTQKNNRFDANAMQGDLKSGDYQFDGVSARFDAP